MAKAFLLGIVLMLEAASGAFAQSAPAPADRGGARTRSGNITSTGETVPNPGASQSAGVTPLDKGVQRDDTRIQSGICKGC